METFEFDVFLGGVCGDSSWRQERAIPILVQKNMTFFNPQVAKGAWKPEMVEIECKAKQVGEKHLNIFSMV